MIKKLQELINNGTIKSFKYEEQLPSIIGDNHSRLVDELSITFLNEEKITFSTFCSGCLENTTLCIKD